MRLLSLPPLLLLGGCSALISRTELSGAFDIVEQTVIDSSGASHTIEDSGFIFFEALNSEGVHAISAVWWPVQGTFVRLLDPPLRAGPPGIDVDDSDGGIPYVELTYDNAPLFFLATMDLDVSYDEALLTSEVTWGDGGSGSIELFLSRP